MQVTPVIDRNYFNAIYFQQPQEILFDRHELARLRRRRGPRAARRGAAAPDRA
jgi:hypothetical protein